MKETFDEWWLDYDEKEYELPCRHESAKAAWDHQQKRIDELESQNKAIAGLLWQAIDVLTAHSPADATKIRQQWIEGIVEPEMTEKKAMEIFNLIPTWQQYCTTECTPEQLRAIAWYKENNK